MDTNSKYNLLLDIITDKIIELLKTPNIDIKLSFGKCGELTLIKIHRNKDNSYVEFGPNLRTFTKFIKSVDTEDIVSALRELIIRHAEYGINGGGVSYKYTFTFPDNYQFDLFKDNSLLVDSSYIPYKLR